MSPIRVSSIPELQKRFGHTLTTPVFAEGVCWCSHWLMQCLGNQPNILSVCFRDYHSQEKHESDLFILVGGFRHLFIFRNIWDNPSHWLIFFRGVGQPPTSIDMETSERFGAILPSSTLTWFAGKSLIYRWCSQLESFIINYVPPIHPSIHPLVL